MGPTQPSAFGALLRRYRQAAGLSQEALAEQAAVSVEAVSALERGVRRAPRPRTVKLLATALRLSAQEHTALNAAAARQRGPRATPDPEPAPPGDAPASPAPLAAFFPPSRALPAPLVHPIGQERTLDAVTALLRGGDAHLLALTGPGGAGKTLLALHAANAARDLFPDGVTYVPLAALPDPAALAAAHARLLDARERGEPPLPEDAVAPLRGQRRLLLLDNYERIAAAAPLLADLCEACPDLTVLVTSRTALHVRGATEIAVPPLALPDPDPDPARIPAVEELARYPAVRLFARRAQDARPGFELTAANAGVVVEICRRLEGLPLAIELAAAHAALLPLPALLDRLERAYGDTPPWLLDGGACDLPPRQRSMRATLDWSYDLLDAATQAVLRRLAACADGCTLEQALAACADVAATPAGQGRAGDIFGRVATLVDGNLLAIDHGGDEPRLTMPALVRAYALRRGRDDGEEDVTWERREERWAATR